MAAVISNTPWLCYPRMQNSAATTIWSRLSSGSSCFWPSLVVDETCLATWLSLADSFGHQQGHCSPPQFFWASTKTAFFFSTAQLTAKVCRYCSPPKESTIVKMAFISYCSVVCWGKMAGPRFREEGVSFITTVVADGYQHPWHWTNLNMCPFCHQGASSVDYTWFSFYPQVACRKTENKKLG